MTLTAKWRQWLPYLGIAVVVAYCLAPFYWMLVSSLRRTGDIFSTSLFPSPVSFENYRSVFSPAQGFTRALLNSLIVAGVTTAMSLLLATFTAYAMARLEFRFKRLILTLIIATSMFPVVSIVVPLLKLFTDIGWINTYQSMIVPSMSFTLPLAVWNLTTFFRQMPDELEHAAMVDGCTRGQAFRKVIVPLAAPGIFTTAIITFIAAWNEFLIALSMTNKPSMQTATVAISKFSGATTYQTPFGSQMAAGVVVTVPLVVMVLLFQRRIVAGLTAGAAK
ncbi:MULTISPECIES: carbohydrate ABC transporter permease [Streptomyces]|uniref:Trehalose transport system permease protein SugB n=1 Tax=Streptomyces chartreusis NRRL 3882 TaxID=1079985 RepID=A0A2N9B466_STRCX|nr:MULTISPECIES: carbohydrate ABC transporter permease [Streptomyces]MYS88960.1 ABC transporter permease subunit [Streptomyces sp. SID5464]SOR78142.1 Trehalose transport system permease protein SugB [Streptomyces chartreusis NRRL 3882]